MRIVFAVFALLFFILALVFHHKERRPTHKWGTPYLTIISVVLSILIILYSFVPHEEMQNSVEDAPCFILAEQYLESEGVLVVRLEYFGDIRKFVTGKDFRWYLNGQQMGSVCSLALANGNGANIEDGDIIELKLKTEEIPVDAKITIIFRDSLTIKFPVSVSK